MLSFTNWKIARSPNYDKNVDLLFPYSELPYVGEYKLVKIPISLKNLIEHVDYWGEGRIVNDQTTSGFTNCYNVNLALQLVSSGPDQNRKIPNRIPVQSHTDCDTSSYVKDNTVLTVTVTEDQLNSSCAKDIARIVNNELGKVVVYGSNSESKEITNLKEELNKKGLFYCPGYKLSDTFKEITSSSVIAIFTVAKDIKDVLYTNVINAAYDTAVNIAKELSTNDEHKNLISDIVIQLINDSKRNVMAYAYKLWRSGGMNIVREHFPASFTYIFNVQTLKIINKKYNQALKLDVHTDVYNDRLAWGDRDDMTSDRVSWKIIPVWKNNSVLFKLYNDDCEMYLKLDVNVLNNGDRQAWGSTNSDEIRHKYYVDPIIEDGGVTYVMINNQYLQGLKLHKEVDGYGDRLLMGHNGTVDDTDDRFKWILESWSPSKSNIENGGF